MNEYFLNEFDFGKLLFLLGLVNRVGFWRHWFEATNVGLLDVNPTYNDCIDQFQSALNQHYPIKGL